MGDRNYRLYLYGSKLKGLNKFLLQGLHEGFVRKFSSYFFHWKFSGKIPEKFGLSSFIFQSRIRFRSSAIGLTASQ